MSDSDDYLSEDQNKVEIDTPKENNTVSALRDNIEKKGKNSYYYAHSTPINAPQWDGNEAPRLLSRGNQDLTKSNETDSGTGPQEGSVTMDSLGLVTKFQQLNKIEQISKYSFSDGKSKVSIYIEIEGCQNYDDSRFQLEHTENSFCFSILPEEEGTQSMKRLNVPNLHDEIEEAIYKRKEGSDRITISLKKKITVPWYNLKKTDP